jgi:hypothetical protein
MENNTKMIPIGTKITIQYHPEPWGTWLNNEGTIKHPIVETEYEIDDLFIKRNPIIWEMLNRSTHPKEGEIIFGPGKQTTIKIIKMTELDKKTFKSKDEYRKFRKMAKRADKRIQRLRDTIAGSSPNRIKIGDPRSPNEIISQELKWPKKKYRPQLTRKERLGLTPQVIEYHFRGISIRTNNRTKAFKEASKIVKRPTSELPGCMTWNTYYPDDYYNKKICIKHCGSGEVKLVSKKWFNLFKIRDANWEEVPMFWIKRDARLSRDLRKAKPHQHRFQLNSTFLRRLKLRSSTTNKARNKGKENTRIKYIQRIPIETEIKLSCLFRDGIVRKTKVPFVYTKVQYREIKHFA